MRHGHSRGRGDQWWQEQHAESLASKVSILEGLVELLETEVQLKTTGNASAPATGPTGHRIFLVHGHDEAAIQGVARFLERLDQSLIVLRDQPNSGRTIIEKFEHYSDVGFAVVLLTADDRGGLKTALDDGLLPRARQNVILELGFFLGKLGRARVCVLYVEGVEVPSDYSGVLFVKLDTGGGWRLELAKELKAAGLPVDMNKAL
ncbi:MAG: nucleotide-binding protein [Rhodobacteraceae bacterium]|nr:nucleotide-binding protein [Paracoccaceae bacterium]